MKDIISLCLLVLLSLSVSCSADSKKDRHTAASDLKVVAPDKDPSKWTFLTADLFWYTYIDRIDEEVPRESYAGRWIKFHDDWTYELGEYADKTSAGEYRYDNELKTLELIPVDGSKRSEWRLLHNNDKVVLAGTSTFEDNATQIRWERKKEKPTAPVAPAN